MTDLAIKIEDIKDWKFMLITISIIVIVGVSVISSIIYVRSMDSDKKQVVISHDDVDVDVQYLYEHYMEHHDIGSLSQRVNNHLLLRQIEAIEALTQEMALTRETKEKDTR